jgi:O-antigen/teichoic acid export membrane protein
VSRFRQFAQGLGSSWLATLATVIYSLLSVPIALRYLSVDEFGLFVLLLQVSAYFALVEIGMSAASGRILVDYKDVRDGGHYGSVILTSMLIFIVQAFVILAVGALASPWIVSAIGVPEVLTEVGTQLLRWLAVTSALVVAFRTYGSVLYANKRLDLIHAFMGINMLFGLAMLYFILSAGGGLEGLVWLFITQAILAIVLPLFACCKLGLLPSAGCWGKPSMQRFRELFGFGKDVFLLNVGNQVLEASQLIIVTRTMGLTAAAIWSVSTKLFGLVYQLVTKVEGTAIIFFAEMMVRREEEKLAVRFRQVYQLTAGLAVVALAVVITVNQSFVSVWANPDLSWSKPLSALIAFMILLNVLIRCNGDLIIHTKKIAAFRYIYFAEAVVFVLLALSLSARFGFYGVIGSSVLCLVVFRMSYTTWRVANYFRLSPLTFWWTWLKRPILAGIILLPFVISSPWLISSVPTLWGQLLSALAWVGLPAAIVLLFVALPRDVRKECAKRCPQLSLITKH